MSRKHLAAYVETKNWVNRLFKKPELDVDCLTEADVQMLLASIDSDLSPENLTCDGELRGAKLKAKLNMINGAKAELEARLRQQIMS